VHSRAKRAVSVVEEAIWWALQAHVSVYVRKKGRGDGAVSVRLTAHTARPRAHDALVAGADHATPRSAIRQSLPR
jgi:hypothetical protein